MMYYSSMSEINSDKQKKGINMEIEEQIYLSKSFMIEVFKKCERKNIQPNVIFIGCLSEILFMGLNFSPTEDSLNESVKLAWEIAKDQYKDFKNNFNKQ